jgi:hypothetical protein
LFLAAGDAHQRANDGLAAVGELAVGIAAVVVALQEKGHAVGLVSARAGMRFLECAEHGKSRANMTQQSTARLQPQGWGWGAFSGMSAGEIAGIREPTAGLPTRF